MCCGERGCAAHQRCFPSTDVTRIRPVLRGWTQPCAAVQNMPPRPAQEPSAGKQAASRALKPSSAEPAAAAAAAAAAGPAGAPRRVRAAKRPASHSDTESEDLLSPHGWDAASCPSEGSAHPRKGWGRTRRRTDGMVSLPCLLLAVCPLLLLPMHGHMHICCLRARWGAQMLLACTAAE